MDEVHDWESAHQVGFERPLGGPSAPKVPADRGQVMLSMQDIAKELVSRAREEGVDLTGEGGLVTELMRQVLQTGLEIEMEEHLGYAHGDTSNTPATPS